MNDFNHDSSKNSSSSIDVINGVNFTPREIDILACILGGRSAKKIASSLSLSPRTVENYTRNIMLKLECNSRENIIDFLDKSDKVLLLRQRYSVLFSQINPYEEESPVLTEETTLSLSPPKTKQKKHIPLFLKGKKGLLALSCLFLCLIVFAVLWNPFRQKSREDLALYRAEDSIHSDLSIPAASSLLELPELIAQLNEKTKRDNGIQTVAIVGPGGAGKTTLARQYAHQQKDSVIWEINAESHESLVSSFENLAKMLAKNKEDQKNLAEIQDVKNVLEREDKILEFVKSRLKNQPSWLLIYDNVENFSDLQKQFPQDMRIWGQGKVILTSRDTNIQNNKYINEVLQMGVLNPDQKLTLFTKIMGHGNKASSEASQTELTHKFLESIPPYPLDISIAAYYIKATNTPYATYLENLTQNNEDFASLQKNLLKEAGDYIKTRYGIITLSLQKLLSTHTDFADLLLFVSLLDSQNIPRVLLDKYKNSAVVDSFIHSLKKYSLILNESGSVSLSAAPLSLHRSTQQESLVFLTKKLALENNKLLIEPIAQVLEEYVAHIIDRGDLTAMKLFVSHCNAFLAHNDILSDTARGVIESKLGGIYFHLGHYDKAKHFLEEGLVNLRKQNEKNQIRIAWALARLGNVYEKETDYEQAKNLFEQSLDIYKKHFADNHVDVPYILTYLGGIYRSLGDYEKATALLEQSLAIYQKYFPDNHAGRARIFVYLGSIHRKRGDYEKSKDFLEQSLAIYKKHFPEDHADTTWASSSLASTYRNLGEYEKAKALFEQSLAVYKKHFSDNHIRIATVSGYLGLTQNSLGNYESAKNYLEQSLSIYKKSYPKNHLDIAWTLANLGIVYKNLGDYKKAKSFLEQGAALYKEHYSKVNVRTAWVTLYLGEVNKELGDYHNAKLLIDEAVQAHEKKLGDDNVRTSWAHVFLGAVHKELGNTKQAQELLEKSLEIHKKEHKEDHPHVGWVSGHLGNVYKTLGHFEKARNLLEFNFAKSEKNYGKDHSETGKVLTDLGDVHLQEGHIDTAEEFLQKSLGILQKTNHPDSYKALEALAELYRVKSKNAAEKGEVQLSEQLKAQANLYLTQAVDIIKASFPLDSPHLIRIQSKIHNP